ncbi:MAG: putative T7SS-secreted protein [Mycobacteriales bacterium]
MTELTPGALPTELVPGEPDEVERLTARLAGFAATAGDAGARLGTLEFGAWSGEAGRLFRDAVGAVPSRLSRAAAAFETAAGALSAYARVLRESQAEAARAVRLVEQATPESLDGDRVTAARMVERARSQVEEAGRLAAARLVRAAADAPDPDEAGAAATAGSRISLRVVGEHELTDPDGFVAPLGEWGDGIAGIRFTAPHEVAFAAGADTGEPAWQAWAAADPGRQLGVVEPATLAALGLAAAGVTAIGRQRRQNTALGLIGLDEAELRRRRDEFGGARHRDGVLTAGRAARLRSADAWRTRLASEPRPEGTVQHWTGSDADRPSRSRAPGERSGSVDRDVRGAVLRTGRPVHDGG